MRFSAGILATLLAFGCSDSTGPDLPNAVGRYVGVWTITVDPGEISAKISCEGGYVAIADQSGTSISGEAVLAVLGNDGGIECAVEPASISGIVGSNGEVRLVVADFAASLTARACIGTPRLEGLLAGDDLTVALGPVVCDGVALEMSFSGSR